MDGEPHIVVTDGIPDAVLVAALYAVANSPGAGLELRQPGPVEISVIQRQLDAEQGCVYFDYVDHRVLKIDISGQGYLDAREYDWHNAGGRPLARAIAERLRRYSPGEFTRIANTREGDFEIAELAREVLAEVSPADAWRIGVFDDIPPEGSELAFVTAMNLTRELLLVRHAWVFADCLVRMGRASPLEAFDGSIAAAGEMHDPRARAYALGILQGVRSELAVRIRAAGDDSPARLAAWRELPERVPEALPMIAFSMQRPIAGGDLAR